MYNLATRLGVDGHQYVQLKKWERHSFKLWLKDNPGKSILDWQNSSRSGEAAIKYRMKLEDWNKLNDNEKNAVKEYCNRYPELNRTGYDWLNGVRAASGPQRTFSLERMVELHCQGLSQSQIAKQLGCNQCHVSRSLKKWKSETDA